jgi:hypothetical protein
MEHRWGQRIALDLPVRLKARPLALGVGRVRNLSLSGAWVGTELMLAPGTLVHLSVELSGLAIEAAAAVEACVVRCEGTGIGVEWCELAPAAVLQWLQGAAGERSLLDPSRLEALPSERTLGA